LVVGVVTGTGIMSFVASRIAVAAPLALTISATS